MVTLTRKSNTVEIVFSGSSTYLYDGKISAPLGSLVLITDQSDMATVRRAPSFDILFSAKIADMEFGGTQATSANINDLFNATCGGNSGGGGGGDMSNYYTKAEIDQASRVVSEALHELHDEKADTSAVTASISAATSGKANSADVYTKTEVDSALSGKADTTAMTAAISAATSGKADTTAMTAAISAATSGKANSSDVYAKTDVDNAPTSGSTNLLTSGTLYNVLYDVLGDIDTALTNIIGGN